MTAFQIGKPTVEDATHIAALVNALSETGLLLPRAVNDVYERLRDFSVAKCGDHLIGCAALHVVWGGLGEIRSLAVAENARNAGVGRALVHFCLQEATQLGIRQVFVLTYQIDFFARFGFCQHPKEALPQKVWKDCVHCPKFPNCDETAMLLDLSNTSNRAQDRNVTSG